MKFPSIPRLPSGKSLAVKRFMARYIFYLEIFGYTAVSVIALAIVACFFFQVDDVVRHQGDPVAIKPRSESIKRKVDSLVTRVLVQKYQQVRRGDPLVEVIEKPEWMSRYLVMRQMQSLLDEFAAPGQAAEIARKRIEEAQKEARKAALAQVTRRAGPAITESEEKEEKEEKEPLPVVPLTPEEETIRAAAAQRLADWEAHGVPHSPRILIRAPIDGIVLAPDDLAFKKVDADAEIMQVVDLNDLRLTAKVGGETVADARTGQKAIVKAIFPDTKEGTILRGDTVPRGRYFWQKERVTFYGLVDPKVKDTVKEALQARKITQRDDIPFTLTEVTDVEINAAVDTSALGSGLWALGGGDGSSSYAQRPATTLAQSPEPRAQSRSEATLAADAPAEFELAGKVLEGKHLLTVQLADLPPTVVRHVTNDVAARLRGQVIEGPQEPEEEGGPVPTRRLRVEAVRGVELIAKVKGENASAKGRTKQLKKEAARTALRGASLERQYEAQVQILNPPPFLKARVLELLEEGKEVKAKVEVKTGRRRVAFLLLKR